MGHLLQNLWNRLAPKTESYLTGLLALASPLALIVIGFFFIRHFNRAFDLTDESFYILNAQDPFSLSLRLFDFGYYLQPLWNLVSQDIYYFRLLGLIVLGVSAAILACSLIRLLDVLEIQLEKLTKLSLVAAMVVGGWMYYSPWLLSPGYNWMALVAIALSVASLSSYSATAISNPSKPAWTPLIGLGIFGALTFFAKPPSAVFLGLVAVIWIMFFPSPHRVGQKIQHIMIALFFALVMLLINFVFVTEGIETAIAEYTLAYEIFNNIKGYQSSSFFIQYQYIARNIFNMIRDDKVFLVLAVLSLVMNLIGRKQFWFRFALFIFAANAIVTLIMTGAPVAQRYGDFLLTMTAQYLILALILSEHKNRKTGLLVFSILVTFTFAFHFGTGSANAFHFAIGFLFFAGAIVVSSAVFAPTPSVNYAVRITSVLVVVASVIGISAGVREPYRQKASIWELTQPIEIIQGTTPLLVRPEQKEYMQTLRTGAFANGWLAGESLLDMTGIRPGITLLLGGHPPAVKWLPLQANVPTRTLASVLNALPPDELANSWILYAPDAAENSRVSSEVLDLIGLSFPINFRKVAHFGGHELWRPCVHADSTLPEVENCSVNEND